MRASGWQRMWSSSGSVRRRTPLSPSGPGWRSATASRPARRCETSAADVFAAGDVADPYLPAIGQHLRNEHWANAIAGGTVAAAAMLGEDAEYDDIPYFYTDQYDLGMEYSGYAPLARGADIVYRGRPGRTGVHLVLGARRPRRRGHERERVGRQRAGAATDPVGRAGRPRPAGR